MSFVSHTAFCCCGTCAPDPGRSCITPTRRDLTDGTAASGLARARLPPERVDTTCSRQRAGSPRPVRGRHRGHQGRTDPRHHVALSTVRGCAEWPLCPIFHGRDVHGPLRKDTHRGQARGVGSLYLAVRKTPPEAARPIVFKYLKSNARLPFRYPLRAAKSVEWVEERVRNSIRDHNFS